MRGPRPGHLPPLPLLAVIGLLAAGAVLVVRARSDVAFGWTTVVAVALAPVAVALVATLGARIGSRTAVAAPVVYVVLPLAARRLFYGPFLQVFDHRVLPSFVGLRHTGWFALGIGVAVALLVVPERIAGVVGCIAALAAAIAWIDVSWSVLYGELHETTWSPTLVSYLPFACIVGLGIRRPWLAASLGGWLAVLVLRGVNRPYYEGGLWLSLAAAAPAIAVLLTSLALLVPPVTVLRRAPLADSR